MRGVGSILIINQNRGIEMASKQTGNAEKTVKEKIEIYKSLVGLSKFDSFEPNIRYRIIKDITKFEKTNIAHQEMRRISFTKYIKNWFDGMTVDISSKDYQSALADIEKYSSEKEELPAGIRTFNDSEDPKKTDIPKDVPGNLIIPLMGVIVIDIDEKKEG